MEEIVCKVRIGSTDCELELRPDGSLWLFVPGEFPGPFSAEALDAGNGVFFTAEAQFKQIHRTHTEQQHRQQQHHRTGSTPAAAAADLFRHQLFIAFVRETAVVLIVFSERIVHRIIPFPPCAAAAGWPGS